MAYQVNTAEANGEDEGSSSSKPTLDVFLSKEIGQNAGESIYSKLSDIGITHIDSLIFIFENDLDELSKALNLNFGEKIKFKAAVSKLQHTFKPKQEQSIVTISTKEQSQIDKITTAIKQSDDLQKAFQRHFNQIDDQITAIQTQINTQIDGIIGALQKRKKALHHHLNEWKLSKTESINKEMANMMAYCNDLKAAKRAIDDLLRNPSVTNREKKIKANVDKLFKGNEKYKVYQERKALEEYLAHNTAMIGVVFQEKLDMKQVEGFGSLNNNIKNDAFSLPSIALDDVTNTKENENGFQAKLIWHFVCDTNEEHKSTDFTVKYAANDKQDDDDTKDEIGANSSLDWIVFDEANIKREEKNKYSLDVATNFKFDTKYVFQVASMIHKPIHILIQSNICCIVVEGTFLDISKEEQIPLTIESHRGNESGLFCGYTPQRILQSNDDCYLSTQNQITNDWIILNVDSATYYYPTKLQVRARGTKHGSTGDPYALKRFGLKIGNKNSNEWIQLNEELFVASKMDPNLQTFNLDIMNHNNNQKSKIVEKWKSIKSKGFKQFKLEILDNYGAGYILIQEFKIFGVKT